MNTRTQTRIFSAFLAMVMVMLLIPVGVLPISAETSAGEDDSSTTDASTIEDESNSSDGLLGLGITFSGEGTAEDPYIIDSKETFCAMYLEPDAHYSLVSNIVFEDSDFAEGGICEGGWQTINTFGGVLNGNGYAISNLQGSNGGFIATNKGTVTSIRFLNTSLKKSNYGTFGVIANYNMSAGVITQCYAEINSSARVTSSDYAGGLVGSNSGTVSGCSTAGRLTVSGAQSDYTWINGVGGIVGYNSGTVVRCYNRANIDVYNSGYITEYVYVGGIAGQGRVSDCRSECSIYVSVRLDYDIYYGEFTAGYQNYATNCYGNVNFSKASLGNNRASIVSTKSNCYTPNSLSTEKKWLESSYKNFDFIDTWMIKNGEPVPQGMMDADGNCYTKVSFYDEIAEDGSHVGESKYANQYGEVIAEALPLTCTCDTTVWQYDDNVHYHTCSCGKKFNTAEHVRNSDDKDCEASECIYCGKAMPALFSHTRNSEHKDCEDSTCIYCDMAMPAPYSHTRNSEDANCEVSTCIYCGKEMPAIDVHYVDAWSADIYRLANFTVEWGSYGSFVYDYSADEGIEIHPHSDVYYNGWFSYSDYGYGECIVTAMRTITLEFSYYTSGYYYTELVISKNGNVIYTASGSSSTKTNSISLVEGDVVTFTASGCGSNCIAKFKLLTPCEKSAMYVQIPITDLSCTNDNYGSGYYCANCNQKVTPEHEWDGGVITTEPTCVAEGVKTYTCTECRDTKTEAVAKLTVHAWDNGAITTAPTYTQKGVMTITCTTCGETKTETLPMLEVTETSPKIVVSDRMTCAGATLRVPISLENNPGVTLMGLTVTFDTDVLELIDVDDTGLLKGATFGNVLKSPYGLTWMDALATENNHENGTIAVLVFRVKDTAALGDTTITVTYDRRNINNAALKEVSFAVVNGNVTVADYLIGDLNADGAISLGDAAIMCRYLAGWEDYQSIDTAPADINGDGMVSLADVTILSRYLAGWEGVTLG